LGIQDANGKKGTAFNSGAARFKSDIDSRNMHNRSKTINGEEVQKPVYDL